MDSNAQSHSTSILGQQELLKLLPDNWITNYGRNRFAAQPLQSKVRDFATRVDGSVQIKFQNLALATASNPIIPAEINMIEIVPAEASILGTWSRPILMPEEILRTANMQMLTFGGIYAPKNGMSLKMKNL